MIRGLNQLWGLYAIRPRVVAQSLRWRLDSEAQEFPTLENPNVGLGGYIVRLEGNGADLPDLLIAAESVQVSSKWAGQTTLSVNIPGSGQIEAINERSGNDLVVEHGKRNADGTLADAVELARAPITSISTRESHNASSISLEGSRAVRYSKGVTHELTGEHTRSTNGAKRSLTAAVNHDIRPGHTVDRGFDSFEVGVVSINVGVDSASMTIEELTADQEVTRETAEAVIPRLYFTTRGGPTQGNSGSNTGSVSF